MIYNKEHNQIVATEKAKRLHAERVIRRLRVRLRELADAAKWVGSDREGAYLNALDELARLSREKR